MDLSKYFVTEEQDSTQYILWTYARNWGGPEEVTPMTKGLTGYPTKEEAQKIADARNAGNDAWTTVVVAKRTAKKVTYWGV